MAGLGRIVTRMARSEQTKGGSGEATGPLALSRLLGLIDALAISRDGLTLSQLNEKLQSPRSSLMNLLRPMVVDGYLACDHGRYRLGTAIFRLAGNVMSVWNFSSTLRPYLNELAQRCEESVYLGVLDKVGSVITYVDAVDSPNPVRFSVPVGAVRPLYSTAAGRVLLAFADHDWVEYYLKHTKLKAYSPYTVTSLRALRDEIARVRESRVAVSMGETFPESGALAAPIFGADGKLIAAIAIGAPVSRLEPRLDELKPIIGDIAVRASGSTCAMLRGCEGIGTAPRKAT